MDEDKSRPAVAVPVQGPVRPHEPAPARWYCVSREGLATLCKDEADAHETVAGCDKSWPLGGPHRAVQLVDAFDLDGLRVANAVLADELDRMRRVRRMLCAELDSWRARFPGYAYRPQDECVALGPNFRFSRRAR